MGVGNLVIALFVLVGASLCSANAIAKTPQAEKCLAQVRLCIRGLEASYREYEYGNDQDKKNRYCGQGLDHFKCLLATDCESEKLIMNTMLTVILSFWYGQQMSQVCPDVYINIEDFKEAFMESKYAELPVPFPEEATKEFWECKKFYIGKALVAVVDAYRCGMNFCQACAMPFCMLERDGKVCDKLNGGVSAGGYGGEGADAAPALLLKLFMKERIC